MEQIELDRIVATLADSDFEYLVSQYRAAFMETNLLCAQILLSRVPVAQAAITMQELLLEPEDEDGE